MTDCWRIVIRKIIKPLTIKHLQLQNTIALLTMSESKCNMKFQRLCVIFPTSSFLHFWGDSSFLHEICCKTKMVQNLYVAYKYTVFYSCAGFIYIYITRACSHINCMLILLQQTTMTLNRSTGASVGCALASSPQGGGIEPDFIAVLPPPLPSSLPHAELAFSPEISPYTSHQNTPNGKTLWHDGSCGRRPPSAVAARGLKDARRRVRRAETTQHAAGGRRHPCPRLASSSSRYCRCRRAQGTQSGSRRGVCVCV